ncbi:hypothetical protein A2U01_0116260, partial [Trifolium medium]|nr:hypothetical protein [Trifolium medium]
SERHVMRRTNRMRSTDSNMYKDVENSENGKLSIK